MSDNRLARGTKESLGREWFVQDFGEIARVGSDKSVKLYDVIYRDGRPVSETLPLVGCEIAVECLRRMLSEYRKEQGLGMAHWTMHTHYPHLATSSDDVRVFGAKTMLTHNTAEPRDHRVEQCGR